MHLKGVGGKVEKRPNPERAKIWLYLLGILGVVIVIFTVIADHIDSGRSIFGYVIGFICVMLAAMAAFTKRDVDSNRKDKNDHK